MKSSARAVWSWAFGLAALALVSSLALFPQRLPRFVLGFAYRGPLVDAARWQRWVRDNPDIFGPLGETARFAIVDSPDDSTGLLFTRDRDGLRVEKKAFPPLQQRAAPVGHEANRGRGALEP